MSFTENGRYRSGNPIRQKKKNRETVLLFLSLEKEVMIEGVKWENYSAMEYKMAGCP